MPRKYIRDFAGTKIQKVAIESGSTGGSIIEGRAPILTGTRSIHTTKSVNSGVTVPLLSIRPKLTFKGQPNHSWVRLKDFQISTSTNGVYQLIYTPVLSGEVWTDVDTDNSLVEYDSTASSYTNGYILYTGVINAAKGADKLTIPNIRDPLYVSSDDTETYHLTIVFTPDSNGTVTSAINWEEIY